jgi:hypothetical protein
VTRNGAGLFSKLAFVAKKVAEAERVSDGKPYCRGIAGMVTKLVERSYRTCEDDEDFVPPRLSSEDEIEHEHEEE